MTEGLMTGSLMTGGLVTGRLMPLWPTSNNRVEMTG